MDEYNKAMNVAVRVLSHRSHTEYELRQKLKQRDFSADVITKIISECKRFNYINDEETARFLIQSLKSRGYGTYRIRLSMKKKGVDNELTDKLLSKNNPPEDERKDAHRAIQNKMKTFDREKDLRKRREKIYRFLYSRGFSRDVISEIIREYS